MKKLLLVYLLFVLAHSSVFAQCTETDEVKVIIIGDSWANFIGTDQVINTALEKWGHSNYKFFTNGILAENGTTTTDYLQPVKLNEIAAQLNAHPSVEVVHLSIGGNDFLNEWHKTWTQAKTDSLLDSVYSRLNTIIDFIKVNKPGIKILWSGYAYPNFGEIIDDMAPFQTSHPFYATWSGMGSPDFTEINTMLNYFSDTIISLANNDPQVDFVPATGLMQYAFGQPTNLGVPPGGNYAQFSAPMPTGFIDYPSPKNSMRTYIIFRDCFHLSPQGYGELLDYQTRKFYQKALMDDQFFISEGGTHDGSVSSQGVVSAALQMGESGADEFSTMLSFNTTVMPDTGVSKASLFLRRQSLSGINPVDSSLQVKIVSGNFGLTVDVEASDYSATADAVGMACRFGSIADDGHWIRLDLPASLFPYITHNNITQFMISGQAASGGLITFNDATDPELAPVLNITYGPSTVSIAELFNPAALNVYPNPTYGNLVIDAPKSAIQELTVFDLPGKQVMQPIRLDNVVNLSELPSGIYFVKIKVEGFYHTVKVVKR